MPVESKDELRRRIHEAFDSVPIPARAADMVMAAFVGNEDVEEMAAEFAGKPWQDIPIQRLFYHRESLGLLSATAYRAYLPAYLIASLASDDYRDKYGPDIRGYMLSTMRPRPRRNKNDACLAERHSLLDRDQRKAIEQVLWYLVDVWESEDAAAILGDWQAREDAQASAQG